MHGRIYDEISDTIGNTPIVKLRLPKECVAEVGLKLEFFNPLSSVKDRIAVAIITDAEQKGTLRPGMRLIEPTSGNTGIGLAFVAAARGYPITLVMPETMSMERRVLLRMLGADIVLTPGANGMKGAIAVAQRLLDQTPNSFMPKQFDNPANPRIHFETTAEEIWRDTAGRVDVVVAGVGTGGTITGVGQNLRGKKPSVRMVAVEPEESPVLSGGAAGPHKIQGIGAGFVPSVLDTKIYDEIVRIASSDAMETARAITREQGIPLGISSGAVAKACIDLARRPENKGKLIIGVAASSTERYLSTLLAEQARDEVAKLPVTPIE